MGNVNCLRCRFRHEDNGNCTEVGGFCTAVPAAHCPLLREYLDTELTPEEIGMDHEAAETLRHLCQNYDLDRLEKLAEADRDGCVVVLPEVRYCERYGWQNIAWDKKYGIRAGSWNTSEEAKAALEAMKDE